MGYGMRARARYSLRPRSGGRPKYGARAGTKRLRGKPAGAGRATKRARSVTKTKTKTKKEQTVRAPPFGGISHSYASLVQKRRYKAPLKDLSSPYTKVDTSFGEITTGLTLGLQGLGYAIQGMEPSFTPNHIQALMEEASNYNITKSGLLAAGANSFSTQRSHKVILDSAITKAMIGNMTSVGCVFDIYDLVAKRDINNVNGDNTPIAAWQRGLEMQQGSNTVPGDFVTIGGQAGMLGAVPTSSQAFNYLWRIAKRTKVELGPGQTHEHTFNHKPNRLLDSARIWIKDTGGTTSVFQALGGLTHRIMLVARGTVVETNDDSGTFSSSHIKLGIIASRTARIRLLTSQPRLTAFGDNLPQVSAATQRYYNPGSGAIDTGVNDT